MWGARVTAVVDRIQYVRPWEAPGPRGTTRAGRCLAVEMEVDAMRRRTFEEPTMMVLGDIDGPR
eukprot:3722554-Lingulodinium_polyedra.AAC.1